MQYYKCSNCGNEVPEGSAFCNKCGAPIVKTTTSAADTKECPHCHATIPTTSQFCPKCGQSTHAAAPAAEPQQAPNQWQQPAAAPSGSNNGAGGDDPNEGNKRSRNVVVAVVILAFLSLVLVRNCYFSGGSQRLDNADTTAVTVDTANQQNTLGIFTQALQTNNFGGDGAAVVYAIRIPGSDSGNPDHIVGITSQSGQGSHTFYKIYDMVQNGTNWDMQLAKTNYLEGQNITFDAGQLLADPSTLPQSTVIDGKRYVYFAYMTQGGGAAGHVVLNLYNIDTKQVVTVNYDGEYKTLEDGQQHIVCSAKKAGSKEQQFLADQVVSIGIIHIKTQEEIDAEKEAETKEAEEEKAKEMESPANSSGKWQSDNVDAMEQLNGGSEVTLRSAVYDKDKPLFRQTDLKDTRSNGAYTVFLTKGGVVYAFNKSEGKNFVVYAGDPKATNIGFENSEKNILNVRTAKGVIEYNLYTNRAKLKK